MSWLLLMQRCLRWHQEIRNHPPGDDSADGIRSGKYAERAREKWASKFLLVIFSCVYGVVIMPFYLNALNIQMSCQVYLPSVCLKLSQFPQFAFMKYRGLCVFNIRLGRVTMVCDACLMIFCLSKWDIEKYINSNSAVTLTFPPQALHQLQTLVIMPCLCPLFWQGSSPKEQIWNVINFAWHDPS